MPSAVKKLNNLPKHSYRFWQVPVSALKRRLPTFDEKGEKNVTPEGELVMRKTFFSDLKLIGEVFSFSKTKEDPGAVCERSYTDFETRLGCARSTVGKSMKACTEAGLIKQTKHFHKKAEYCCDGFAKDEFHITIEQYLTELEFYIPRENRSRKLNPFEVVIISDFATYSNMPGAKGVEYTVQELHKKFGASTKTVRKTLKNLVSAGFASCRQTIHGCRYDVRLHFNINADVLKLTKHEWRENRRAQTERRRAEEARKEQIRAADEKAKRERYYDVLRQQAEDRAQQYRDYAERDGEFREIQRALASLGFKQAEAEYKGLRDILDDLQRQETELKARKAKALARLRIKEEDLSPKYRCPKCKDKGFLLNGIMCDCYDPPGGDP